MPIWKPARRILHQVGSVEVRRGAVFVLLATYWAAVSAGGQHSLSPPGALYDLWYSAAPLIVGVVLSLACGFSIGRWWAVLAGLAPLATLGVLELLGHVAPWHESGPPLTRLFAYGLPFALSTILVFWIGPIAAGVALRKGLGPRRAHNHSSLSR